MATDGPTPNPCPPELMERGEHVGSFETFGANHFESLVKQVADETGKPVDWHYAGGIAQVLAFPEDTVVVSQAVQRIIPPALKLRRVTQQGDS